jgi:hypothetical protein
VGFSIFFFTFLFINVLECFYLTFSLWYMCRLITESLPAAPCCLFFVVKYGMLTDLGSLKSFGQSNLFGS